MSTYARGGTLRQVPSRCPGLSLLFIHPRAALLISLARARQHPRHDLVASALPHLDVQNAPLSPDRRRSGSSSISCPRTTTSWPRSPRRPRLLGFLSAARRGSSCHRESEGVPPVLGPAPEVKVLEEERPGSGVNESASTASGESALAVRSRWREIERGP